MAAIEKENIYNVHGYIKANMVVLHSRKVDHKDGDKYIYIPTLFVINPEQIYALKAIKLNNNNNISNEPQVKTTIYFINKESEEVYEDINEILDLLSQQLEIQEHLKNKNNN